MTIKSRGSKVAEQEEDPRRLTEVGDCSSKGARKAALHMSRFDSASAD